MGCPLAPATTCETGAKIQIQVNEKTFGKEQIKVKVANLFTGVPLSFFGDPVTGTTGYAVCLYDETNTRVAAMQVNRAKQQCGTRPCWKISGGNSYKYSDRLLAADGMLALQLKSGAPGVGLFNAKGKNNLGKGMTALPIGVAAKLTGDRHATVQLMSSNAGCVTGTVNSVHDAVPSLFKGATP